MKPPVRPWVGFVRRPIDKVSDDGAAADKRCRADGVAVSWRDGRVHIANYYYFYYRRRLFAERSCRWQQRSGAALVRRRVNFLNAENTPSSVLAVSDGNRSLSPYSCTSPAIRDSPHLVSFACIILSPLVRPFTCPSLGYLFNFFFCGR